MARQGCVIRPGRGRIGPPASCRAVSKISLRTPSATLPHHARLGRASAGREVAAVTAVEPAPDGSIYVDSSLLCHSCAGERRPPILRYDATGKLLQTGARACSSFRTARPLIRAGNPG